MNKLISLAMLIFIFSCTDLRNKTSKKNPEQTKATKLMKEMGVAHGIHNWDQVNTYNVRFEDEFLNKLGKKSKPYPDDKTSFLLSYIPKTFDGQMRFTSGSKKGDVWGIQSWKTYTYSNGTGLEFKKDKDISFWVPTYQYFIEFPLRIQEANALAYAGLEEIDGNMCEGIVASWNTTKPQKSTDQYLIWLDAETKRIHKLEYTIRDMFSFLTGAVTFEDYKTYDGILLPSSLPVTSNIGKDFLHEMRIIDFIPNQIEADDLRPDKSLRAIGDEK